MPDHVIDQVDTMGKRFQKENRENKLEFLNRQKLKFDWDNDELEVNKNLEIARIHPKIPANFPGIELERDVIGAEGSPDDVIPITPEVEAHEAKVNAGIIEPANKAPSIMDNVVAGELEVSPVSDDVADMEL